MLRQSTSSKFSNRVEETQTVELNESTNIASSLGKYPLTKSDATPNHAKQRVQREFLQKSGMKLTEILQQKMDLKTGTSSGHAGSSLAKKSGTKDGGELTNTAWPVQGVEMGPSNTIRAGASDVQHRQPNYILMQTNTFQLMNQSSEQEGYQDFE